MIQAQPRGSEALTDRVATSLAGHLSDHVPRLAWEREQVRAHQRSRLRALLAHALEHSPFHAQRITAIDPERFELGDLPSLPVMSKAQMMASFDELVTDRRLTRALVEQHLGKLRREPQLLLDQYVCLASGGSSGLRGVFVQTLDAYTQFVASIVRGPLAHAQAHGGPPQDGIAIGLIGAASPVHSSGFGAATVSGSPVRFVSAPATLPIERIVARLNTASPDALQGYPSVLRQLAQERGAGRLRIAPRSVTSMGETLSAEDRDRITAGFGVPVTDLFVSTEGLAGRTEPGERVFTFASDMCIVELVDEHDNPVEPGAISRKALVTNLHNFTQPLIRYELSDQFIANASDARHGHLRARVEGRSDTVFRYENTEVLPFAIRSALTSLSSLSEYQIRQTRRGLHATLIADSDLDHRAVADRLREALRAAGLSAPEVSVEQIEAIERHPQTAKTRRFIPLAT